MASRVRVAIIGLGFGAEFIPIYQNHPDAEMYAVCQRNPEEPQTDRQRFKIAKQRQRIRRVLKDPNVDAVHINSPIPDHAPHVIAPSRPASTSPARSRWPPRSKSAGDRRTEPRKAKKKYMMMETVVFTREFIYVKKMYDSGETGPAAIHARLPPAGNGRLARLLGRFAADVLRHPLRRPAAGLPTSSRSTSNASARGGSPTTSSRNTAHPSRSKRAISASAIRPCRRRSHSLAVQNGPPVSRESFDIYCDKVSFEWSQIEHEPAIFTGETPERVTIPDYARLLPEGIRRTPPRACTTATKTSISRSSKVPGTAAPTPTWPTNSCAPSSKTANPGSMNKKRQLDLHRNLCTRQRYEKRRKNKRAGIRLRISAPLDPKAPDSIDAETRFYRENQKLIRSIVWRVPCKVVR